MKKGAKFKKGDKVRYKRSDYGTDIMTVKWYGLGKDSDVIGRAKSFADEYLIEYAEHDGFDRAADLRKLTKLELALK